MTAPPAGATLPGDFLGPAMAARPETWTHALAPEVRAELATLGRYLEEHEPDPAVERAGHDALAAVTARTVDALDRGPGFLLLRGVPIAGRSVAALRRLYPLIGRALGRPAPQSLDGELLTDIRDTGDDPGDPETRLYKTRAEQDFHTDGADVIGLLCLHGARSGGASRIVSSVRVYQEVRARRPDLAPLLHEPWHFHVPGAQRRGLPGAVARPIATFDGRKLETFFIGWYLRKAELVAGVPSLSAAQRELLDLYEATANDPALYLEMAFQPGDIQWLRNAFVLHKRTSYEDHDEPARKRHLLRLWLALDRLADGTPTFASAKLPTGAAPRTSAGSPT